MSNVEFKVMDSDTSTELEKKLIRPNKSIFSNHVYCGKADEHSRDTLKSVSTNFLIKNERCKAETSSHVPCVKNCCTQTSKTILQLAKLESGDISPDSLTESPKHAYKTMQTDNYSNQTTYRVAGPSDFTCDDVYKEPSCITFSRRGHILEYQSESGDTGNLHLNSPAYPDGALTEAFLEKKKIENETNKSGTISTNRSTFLQQTSPLRNIMTSQKSIYTKNTEMICDSQDPTHFPKNLNRLSRFKVRSITSSNNNTEEERLIRCFCKDIVRPQESEQITETTQLPRNIQSQDCSGVISPRTCNFQQRRSNSFMNPTIASNNKSQNPVIENTKMLISPIRRGRSTSPQKHSTNQPPPTNLTKRIPYIDQNETPNISSSSIAKTSDSIRNNTPSSKSMLYDDSLLKISLDFQQDACSESQNDSDSSSFVARTDIAVCAAIAKIRDPDWNVALRGLAEIVEISRNSNPTRIYPHMTIVNQKLIDLLRSPRSHVCRTACQAAGHLFEYIKDTRRPEFDDIVEILLFKTADSNKFIRQDANLALDCMVTHIGCFHAVRALCAKGPAHKNHLVRTATVRLLVCVAVIAGPDVLFNPNNNEVTRRRLIQHMAKFIEDKNYETRKFGERLFKVLCKDSRFDLYLQKYLDKDSISHMKKQVRLLHQKK